MSWSLPSTASQLRRKRQGRNCFSTPMQVMPFYFSTREDFCAEVLRFTATQVVDDVVTKEANMADNKESRNKELVLKAFDALFNRRDYAEAERYWSPGYIQHRPDSSC